MIILGIETSCDDTSAAIFDGQSLLANIVSTQLVHRNFGGIVPELASRSHVHLIMPVIQQALDQAGLLKKDLQGIAVTYGPGLAGSLLVGLSVAKGLALALNIPFVGINHIEGHIWANRLNNPDLNTSFVVLVASGGHTQIVFVSKWGSYEVLGRTRDDAAGEAFDKVGKLLKVGFPGGPVIEKLAEKGKPDAIRFPRAYLDKGSLDFSFSGLKTAVLNYIKSVGCVEIEIHLANIAASFQEAIFDVLVDKTITAAQNKDISIICLAGGVVCNKRLQKRMITRGNEKGFQVLWPSASLCSDNGGMIARAGHYYLEKKKRSPLSLAPNPSLSL
jgi:N6-L-threonylcarbamoyladenine synthase